MLDSPIEEIKSRLNIIEVLADYIQLKKAGTNYKAVCPFHNEKTPSFMVSPSKQIWHCFGCGLGGDIFEFVKLVENVEFAEALKILADRAGVELKKPTFEQIQTDQKKNVLYEINKAAAEYFEKVLWESESAKPALEYLRERGLTDQTIKNWQLGWSPDDFHYLENFLAKSFRKDDITTAGLIVKKEDGSYFDRFRGRIMFPILNLHGQVVGFTGRLLIEKQDAGKYINSPETPIYNKSRVIYGLYAAKNAIRKNDYAIVVEGNMDVITSHQADFTQTVASSGTAFTEQQLSDLARFTKNLIFAFDGDSAGLSAAERTLEIGLRLGFNIRIVRIVEAKDPDEMIKRGIGLWRKAVESAEHYIDFVLAGLTQTHDPKTPEGIEKIESKMLPLINYVNNPVIKAHFVRKLALALNVAEKALFDRLNSLKRPQVDEVRLGSLKRRDRVQILEDLLLGLSIKLNDKSCLTDLDTSYFTDENVRTFTALINSDRIGIDDIKQLHPELGEKFALLEFSANVETQEQGLNPKEELARVAGEFKKATLKNKMERIAGLLASAEKQKDKDAVKKLSEEYVLLTQKIALLNNF